MTRRRSTTRRGCLIATALLATVVLWPATAHAAVGNWVQQTSGSSATLEAVDAPDASHAWIAGSSGTILSTTDGGFHWSAQISGTPNGLYALSFPDASHGWAAGINGVMRTTSDGGAHWTGQSTGSAAWYTGLSFPDASHGWAVGDMVARSTGDGGAHWGAQSTGASLWAVRFVDALDGWGVGASGTISRTTDGGANWAPQISGTGNYLNAVDFVDASQGWVVGAQGTILVTSDGGGTWTSQPSGTLSSLRSVSFADALHGCAVGDGGTVLLTEDGGTTWTPQPSGVTSVLNGVTMPDPTHAWVAGDGGVVLAYTLGPTTSLEATPAPNAAGWNAGDVSVSLIATEGPQGGGPAETYFSVDGGTPRSDTRAFTISDEGSHSIEYFSVDASGNAEPAKTAAVRLDRTPPHVTGAATVAPNAAGWYRSAVRVHFSATDAVSGVADVSPDALLAAEGPSQSVEGTAHDLAGNEGTGTASGINIDLTPPHTEDDHRAAYTTSATIALTPSDGLSGVAGTDWSLDGNAGTGTSVETTEAGPHVLTYYSTDFAGNPELLHTVVFTVLDVTAPVTTISALPSGWVDHPVRFSLDATDDAGGLGVGQTLYSLDSSPAETYSGPVEVAREGAVTIGYASVDAAGNRETTKTAEVYIDLTPPSTTDDHIATYTAEATITLAPSDALSGVAFTRWALDGADGTGTVVATAAVGPHTLEYASTDVAGNREATRAVTFTVVAAPLPPAPPPSATPASTSISRPGVSPRTPRHHRRATFSATLAPAAARGGTSRLYLYRYERTTVRRKVNGVWKRVTVRVWRRRVVKTMSASPTGRVSATVVIPYAGRWCAQVRYGGSAGYSASRSAYAYFSAR